MRGFLPNLFTVYVEVFIQKNIVVIMFFMFFHNTYNYNNNYKKIKSL